MGRLTDLPPEIIVLILQNLSTPADLCLAIQAVPLFYHVFLENEAAVGPAIRYGIFHKATLPLAIGACRANLGACDIMRQRILRYPGRSYTPHTCMAYES